MAPSDMFHRVIDHLRQLLPICRKAFVMQTSLAPLDREPRGIPVSFLRRFQLEHFAQVCIHHVLIRRLVPLRILCVNVGSKRTQIDSSVSSGLFYCFSCRRSSATQIVFHAAFRERPSSGARLHEQKFHLALTYPVTNGCDVLRVCTTART